jgi:dipeptidyl aminopeptidase/acylaminoacyl peptidase
MANGAPVMFFHGSADPVSGIGDLAQVMSELNEAGIPHGAEIYGGARHTFTVPDRTTTSPPPMPTAGPGCWTFLDETM